MIPHFLTVESDTQSVEKNNHSEIIDLNKKIKCIEEAKDNTSSEVIQIIGSSFITSKSGFENAMNILKLRERRKEISKRKSIKKFHSHFESEKAA